jgi:hypothetical protein
MKKKKKKNTKGATMFDFQMGGPKSPLVSTTTHRRSIDK